MDADTIARLSARCAPAWIPVQHCYENWPANPLVYLARLCYTLAMLISKLAREARQ